MVVPLVQELGGLETKPKIGGFPKEKGQRNSSPHSNVEGPSQQHPIKAGLVGESMFSCRRYAMDARGPFRLK